MHSDALGAYFLRMEYRILQGDCIEQLRTMEENSVHTCVTSPPYYGLRDYGHDGQIGLEKTPEAYVTKLVEVFRELRRVLRDDGTLWLNLGDSYAGGGTIGRNDTTPEALARRAAKYGTGQKEGSFVGAHGTRQPVAGLKPKDLVGIPWRVAFALQADGWYLRQDIIWHKPNPMPESVTDRCTKAHEYIFLLSKSARYYYDAEAVKIRCEKDWGTRDRKDGKYHNEGSGLNPHKGLEKSYEYANRRSVWTVTTQPYPGAHFATFPPDLIRPCIQAGCPPGGFVLDPFGGSGTTAQVAIQEGRNAVIIELNPKYVELAQKRISGTQMPLI
jgi:site-specific DNA-methyltransferase (adenine-specific)